MGAQMVREVASKTNDIAGDGTTTATVLAQAIVREGAKAVAAGMARVELQHGKDETIRKLAEEIIAAQESEIKMMKEWLARNGG